MCHVFLLFSDQVAHDNVLIVYRKGGLRQIFPSVVVHLHLSNFLFEVGSRASQGQGLDEHGVAFPCCIVICSLSRLASCVRRVLIEEDLVAKATDRRHPMCFSHCLEVVQKSVLLSVEFLNRKGLCDVGYPGVILIDVWYFGAVYRAHLVKRDHELCLGAQEGGLQCAQREDESCFIFEEIQNSLQIAHEHL